MCQFASTYNIFAPAVKATKFNLDKYEEWIATPEDLKAAALYVHFYPQIMLAWHKCKRDYVEEETAVSTVLQYLHKNVPRIEWQRKRYSPQYIYQIAFNALYCLTRNESNHTWLYDVMFNSFYEQRNETIASMNDYDETDFMEPSYQLHDTLIESFDESESSKQTIMFWRWIRQNLDKNAIRAIEKILKDKEYDLTVKQRLAFHAAKPMLMQYIMENCPELLSVTLPDIRII